MSRPAPPPEPSRPAPPPQPFFPAPELAGLDTPGDLDFFMHYTSRPAASGPDTGGPRAEIHRVGQTVVPVYRGPEIPMIADLVAALRRHRR